jgi:hypothetical protein
MNNVRVFNDSVSDNLQSESLNTFEFYNSCSEMMLNFTVDFQPATLLNVLENFEGNPA